MSEGKSLRGKVIAAIGNRTGHRPRAFSSSSRSIGGLARTMHTSLPIAQQMASEISGRIIQILITNDQDVAKGAPLLVIDPAPYEFQLRQARAQVAALKAQIALTGRQVTSQGSGVQAAESQVQKARDQLRYAAGHAQAPRAVGETRLRYSTAVGRGQDQRSRCRGIPPSNSPEAPPRPAKRWATP